MCVLVVVVGLLVDQALRGQGVSGERGSLKQQRQLDTHTHRLTYYICTGHTHTLTLL